MRVQKPTTRQPGYNTGITGGISGINNQVPPPATGQVSPDALVTGGPAAQWVVPESMNVLVYAERDRSYRERLSDHCPVSIRLRMP